VNTEQGRRIVGALTAAASLALASCATTDAEDSSGEVGEFEGRGPITFVTGKDNTGTVQGMLDEWNAEHPDEKATLIELPESGDQQRQQHIQNAETRSDAHTVIAVDVVWTAEFAANGWIERLPEEQFPTDEWLPPILEAATYRDGLYGAPRNSDGGLLYYRTDLLEKAGFAEPPTTWSELAQQCDKVLALPEADGMSCYAGQFEKYEGLTVNFAEAVQSAGGAIVDPNGTPTVDTPQAEQGLDTLAEGFSSGQIPREAITYKEEEGRDAFQKGELVFHRQWPYQYSLANAEDGSSEVAGKFDVAPLPGVDGPGSSSLGGWNLAVSSFAENKATALDFIKFMTSEELQRENMLVNSEAPVYGELYEDPELVEKYPYLPVLKESILSAEPRPRVVRYGDTTAAIQDEAYAALTGAKTTEQALADLQAKLDKLTGGQ
jgi:multiple sugar transport system substrate-binding protein